MELFKAYKSKKKDALLVIMKINGQDPQSFIVRNLAIKIKKLNINNAQPRDNNNSALSR